MQVLTQHDGTINVKMNTGIDYSFLKSDAKCLMPSRSTELQILSCSATETIFPERQQLNLQ